MIGTPLKAYKKCLAVKFNIEYSLKGGFLRIRYLDGSLGAKLTECDFEKEYW